MHVLLNNRVAAITSVAILFLLLVVEGKHIHSIISVFQLLISYYVNGL